MGAAMEVITGRVLNPGATLTAVTPGTGDSTVVRNFSLPSMAHLENMWAQGATAGAVRFRSPRMHDNVQNFRTQFIAADPRQLLPYPIQQPLYPQDQIILEQSGGGAETDCVGVLLYYEDLPGANARLAKWAEIEPRVQNILTAEVNLTTGGTAGDYGGAVPINTTFDLLKANVDYAILGYEVSVAALTVGIRSPDFGNLRVGGPGSTQRDETRQWFLWNDMQSNFPFIPVFNAANKGSTIIDLVSTATAQAVIVDLVLAQLATG